MPHYRNLLVWQLNLRTIAIQQPCDRDQLNSNWSVKFPASRLSRMGLLETDRFRCGDEIGPILQDQRGMPAIDDLVIANRIQSELHSQEIMHCRIVRHIGCRCYES
jgi:hypothetical protein